jgi:hypothetical protein
MASSEQRIVELILKAIGDDEVKKMASELLALRRSAEDSQKSLHDVSAQITELGEKAKKAAEVVGLYEIFEKATEAAKQAIEQMETLAKSIQKVGIAAADLQKLQFAAQQSGVGIEALEKGMVKLSVNMANLSGKATPATRELANLGITAKTSTLEAMEKLADQFAKMPDGAQKTALAVAEFGKAGAELIPLLNRGGEGIKELSDEAEKLGIVLKGETIAGGRALAEELNKLELQVTAVTEKILGGMAPALITLAKYLSESTDKGTDFAKMGRDIGDAVEQATEQLARGVAYVKAYGAAVQDVLEAKNAAWQSLSYTFSDAHAARSLEDSAKSYLKSAQSMYLGAASQADAAAKHVADTYKQTTEEIQAAGAKLDKGGQGTGDGDLGSLAGPGHQKKVKTPVDTTYRDAMKELTEQLKLYENAAEDALKVTLTQREAWDKSATALNNAADPLRQYLADSAKLIELQKNSNLSQAAADLEMKNITQRYDDQKEKLYENTDAYKANQLAIQQHAEMLQKLQQTWGFVADAAAEATNSIIQSTESIGTAVRRMVATIISQLVKLELEKFATQLLSGLFGSSLSQVNYGNLSSAAATVKIPGFASGGVVGAPTAFASPGGIGIAGEAGPEMIAPLKRDSSGNLGVGAVQPHVTVNNYHGGADVAVSQTPQGLQIDVVRKQLADDIARGGNPVSRALERTYGVGRYAGAYG